MSIDTFKATHCGVTFAGKIGAADLEAHMALVHGRKPLHAGGPVIPKDGLVAIAAPGWSGGKIQSPTPWKAPRVPKDWEANLKRIVALNRDDVTCDELAIADGHYSNLVAIMESRGHVNQSTTEPPYAAMPATLATIVKASVARGEYWHVVVADGVATLVELAVTDTSPTTYARARRNRRGWSCRVKIDGSYHHVLQNMAGMRRAFGPAATRTQAA